MYKYNYCLKHDNTQMIAHNDSVLPTHLAHSLKCRYGLPLNFFTGGIFKSKDTSELLAQLQQKQTGA
jgi:hypothetical protein